MKKILNNYRFIFTGLLVMACLLVARNASATWTIVQHTENYQVISGDPITVTLTGTTPITLPNHTTTLTWTTTNSPDSCDATVNGLWAGAKSPSGGSEQVSDLYSVGIYTYEIICHKAGFADASSQTQVEVLPANGVTATLTSNTYTLPYGGGSATLTWGSTGATACNSGDFTTGGATSGNDTVNLTTTTTYTVICDDGMGNSAQAQVTILVLPQQQGGITVALSANPLSMNLPNDSTTLTWVTTGTPDSCVASNGWSGNKNINGGTENMNGLSLGTHIYTITCMKSGYSPATSQATVTVFPKDCTGFAGGKDAGAGDAGAPPVSGADSGAGSTCFTASLFANPSVLPYGGGNSTLTWNSLPGGVSCDSPDFTTNNTPNGSTNVNVSNTTTYHLTCQDSGGNVASAQATITVLENEVVNGMCLPSHWLCSSPIPSIHRTGGITGPWTWDCPGSNGGTTASCSESASTHQCSDGADNDADSLIDIADPGCHTDGNASNDFTYNPNDDSEADILPQCSDLIDNDGDGKIDFGGKNGDPGCSSALDNSESNNPKPKQIEI